MCDVQTKCLCLYMHCGKVFAPPVDCLGTERCWQAKNNYLINGRKNAVGITSCCVVQLCDRFPCADFDFKKFTVQSRLKIANNPNFDSTSIHCSAATAKIKTNLLKDNISIQFEGQPCNRTPRDLQIVVEDFAFFVALEWIDIFPCPVLSTCSLYSRR